VRQARGSSGSTASVVLALALAACLAITCAACAARTAAIAVPSDFAYVENVRAKRISVEVLDVAGGGERLLSSVVIDVDPRGNPVAETVNGIAYRYAYGDDGLLVGVEKSEGAESLAYAVRENAGELVVSAGGNSTVVDLSRIKGAIDGNDRRRRLSKMVIDGTYNDGYAEERKTLDMYDNSVFVRIVSNGTEYRYYYKYAAGKYIGCDEFVAGELVGTFAVDANDAGGNWTEIRFDSVSGAETRYRRRIETY
jgi:hypothetical protein